MSNPVGEQAGLTKAAEAPENPATVGVIAKVIAAGGSYKVDKKEDKKTLTLRVSLQLTPCAGGKVPLDTWPRTIRSLLEKSAGSKMLNLELVKLWRGHEPEGNVPKLPQSTEALLSWPRLAQAYPAKSKAIGEAGVQWQKALMTFYQKERTGKDAEMLWGFLKDQLANSVAGKRWKTQLEDGDAGEADLVVRKLLVNDQRRQAAHLEVMRALEVVASMTGTRRKMDRALATATPGPQLLADDSTKIRARLKEKGLNPDDLKEEEGQELLAEARAAELERLKKEWAVDAAAAGKAAFEAATADLNETTPPETVIKLQTKQACDCGNLMELAGGLQPSLNSHAYTTWRNPSADPHGTAAQTTESKEPSEEETLLLQRFYNIQSTPALSRLFLLTVDAELDGGSLESGYYWLSLDLPWCDPTTSRVRTLALLVNPFKEPAGPPKENRPVSFWPAQRREVEDTYQAFIVDQQHGVQKLGGKAGDAPRFELTSLDVRSAAEAAYQQNRRRASGPQPAASGTTEGERGPAPESITLVTGGLTLIDGDRLGAVARRLAARNVQNDSGKDKDKDPPISLDADDLLTGYAIDVAVATKKGEKILSNWRPLMNRRVVFDKPGGMVRVILDALVGSTDTALRQTLDSALLSPALKFAPEPSARPAEPGKQVNAVAEQIVATWDGGPMGVECAGAAEDKTTPGDLPFDQTVSLQEGGTKESLVQLQRIGRAYRVGIRSMFQGGVGPSLPEAAAIYDREVDAAYPPLEGGSLSALAFKRHLRHDRIGPPQVLLPVSRAFGNEGKMGFETASHAIVRSMLPADGGKPTAERAVPARTHRYIVPPSVSQDVCKSHGVFDASETIGRRMPNVGVVAPGNFPVVANIIARGLNADPIILNREVTERPTGPAEGVFATVANLGGRPADSPLYFPDPHARHYVAAARHAGTSDYVAGALIDIPVHEPMAQGSPPMPLRLSIEKTDGVGVRKPVFEVRPVVAQQEVPPPGKASFAPAGKVRVAEVAVNLAPGDDFEIDVWCVPDLNNLARESAVVEMIAALALHRGLCHVPTTSELSEDVRFREGLKDLFCDNELLKQDIAALKSAGTGAGGTTGPMGLVVPGNGAVALVAQLIHGFMLKRPLPELSAVATLRVTHAVNAPLLAPLVPDCEKEPGCWKLAARRLTRSVLNDLSVHDRETRYGEFFGAEELKDRAYRNAAASDLALAGTIAVDTDSASAFRIHANVVFPRATLFDDPARRRSAADRRQGTWPVERLRRRDPDDNFAIDRTGPLVDYLMPPATIFGFHVDADGHVELPRTRVTLLTVHRLPSARQADAPSSPDGRERIQLDQLYGILDDSGRYKLPQAEAATATQDKNPEVPPNLKGVQVKLEHAFPDGKARLLQITVESISRHAQLMSQVAHEDRDGNYVPSNPLPDAFDSLSMANPAEIWLDATVRPAKPETRSAVPVFRWNTVNDTPAPPGGPVFWSQTVTRKSAVRLRLRRGWFSSGEDERLGIVLWPPNLFVPNKTDLAKDEVTYMQDWAKPGGESVALTLGDFDDDDLGPGGRYITRWGGDPIRHSSGGITGRFISPGQFADRGKSGDAGPTSTEPVEMPVARIAEAVGAAGDEENGGAIDYLTVALLTYMPRFDVDREEWYVDVDINLGDAPDPFVRLGLVRYQKHAPRYLQVSEPVVEWAQLLPDRHVTVRLSEADQRYIVEVQIRGLASTGAKVANAELQGFEKAYQYPILRIRLVAEYGPPDALERHVLENTFVDCLDPAQYSTDNGHSVWKRAFAGLPDKQVEGARLFVTVEETDMRLKATLDNEPVPLLAGGKEALVNYTESGPRFIARIDLPEILPGLRTEARAG